MTKEDRKAFEHLFPRTDILPPAEIRRLLRNFQVAVNGAVREQLAAEANEPAPLW